MISRFQKKIKCFFHHCFDENWRNFSSKVCCKLHYRFKLKKNIRRVKSTKQKRWKQRQIFFIENHLQNSFFVTIISSTFMFTNSFDFAYHNWLFKIFSLQHMTTIILISFVVMKKSFFFITFVIFSNICVIIWSTVQNVKSFKFVDTSFMIHYNQY